jgi:hypothetical protein
MKLLIKLAIAGLIANAAWQAGRTYADHYQFRDAVRQAALIRGQSDDELRQRILDLAAEYDIPLAYDGFTIRHELRHTFVQGEYVRNVPLAPGYQYPWRFTWDVDAYIVEPPKMP